MVVHCDDRSSNLDKVSTIKYIFERDAYKRKDASVGHVKKLSYLQVAKVILGKVAILMRKNIISTAIGIRVDSFVCGRMICKMPNIF